MKDDEQLKSKAHEYVLNHYESSGYGTVMMNLEENAYMAGYKVAMMEVLNTVRELSYKGMMGMNESIDHADWSEYRKWEGYRECAEELMKKLMDDGKE